MKLASDLRRRLTSDDAIVGSWLALGDCAVSEIMARAGFDFLVIDLEHAPTSPETAAAMIRVIDLAGCCPLVRVAEFSPAQIKQVLDAGAHGIIVPNVQNAKQAQAIVRSTRFPPAGTRGVGLYRAQGYGSSFDEYLESCADGLLIAVQIESMTGVQNIDEIVSVEGIDAVLVGPYDLSADLGIPGEFQSLIFTAAVQRVLEGATASGVATGVHVVEPDPAGLRENIRKGHRFLVYSVDMRILETGARLGARSLTSKP